MPELLSDDLIDRVRRRATNPETRTDASPTARGKVVSVGPMTVVGADLGALLRGEVDPTPRPSPESLPPPADMAVIANAERSLGVPLPTPLKQLYSSVANGGFGPGAGLLALEDAVAAYRDLIATPPGWRRQKWPTHLLPITRTNPGHECIDVNSGAMIYWDEEVLADGPSDKVWRRSFRPDAADLGEWLERWLATVSPEQRMKDQMQQGMLSGIRQSLDYWRAKTPEERAAFGLPEKGWEEALFGHLGIDLSKL